MANERYVIGLFEDEHRAAGAVRALGQTPWRLYDTHSPIPSEVMNKASGRGKSRVGWFTLAGGIVGFCIGFALAAFTASRYDLVVGGKPIFAWVPFVIVGFECTILFSVFGNVAGLIHQMRLPEFKGLKRYDKRCSEDRYGVVAACGVGDEPALEAFFQKQGAETRLFDEA